MTFHKMVLSVLAISSVVQGCSIQSSQVSSILAEFQKPAIDLRSHSWVASYGEYSATVYAISTPNGTLFSNKFGDSFLFDGWSVREISGLGLNRADWKVVDSNKKRQFFRGARLVAEHQCKPWLSEKNSEMVRFSQDCKSFKPHTNNILINDRGHITFIRQIVNGGNTFLTLSKK